MAVLARAEAAEHGAEAALLNLKLAAFEVQSPERLGPFVQIAVSSGRKKT